MMWRRREFSKSFSSLERILQYNDVKRLASLFVVDQVQLALQGVKTATHVDANDENDERNEEGRPQEFLMC